MSKSDANQTMLVGSSSTNQSASQKIPIIARSAVSERAKKTLDLVCSHLGESTIMD